jgi:hypothetical protein
MANSVSPKLKRMVRRLMAYEYVVGDKPPYTRESLAFRLCGKLRQPLVRLTGVAGFRSLLARALTLTAQRIGWMKAVHVTAEGDLGEVAEAQAGMPPGKIAEGEIELMAQLIGLLVTFIGAELTGQLLREAWPKAAVEDLND